jgi:hypothetical protein
MYAVDSIDALFALSYDLNKKKKLVSNARLEVGRGKDERKKTKEARVLVIAQFVFLILLCWRVAMLLTNIRECVCYVGNLFIM